jgi:hypothetical protein
VTFGHNEIELEKFLGSVEEKARERERERERERDNTLPILLGLLA